MTRGVVFDVDDTLYLERDYVMSGFAHIGERVSETSGERETVIDWLRSDFAAGGRSDTFDRLLASFPSLAARVTVDELVTAYRRHIPNIELPYEARTVLDSLRTLGLRLGILTDGPRDSQTAKVRVLGLRRWCDPVMITGAMDGTFAKPATAGFERIAAEWGLRGSELAYIADNPAKDFAGPNRLGWRTFRLRRAGQIHFVAEPTHDVDRPDAEFSEWPEAIDLLAVGR